MTPAQAKDMALTLMDQASKAELIDADRRMSAEKAIKTQAAKLEKMIDEA